MRGLKVEPRKITCGGVCELMCLDKGGQLGDWERVRGTDMKATELVDISDRCVCVCEMSGEG